MNEIKCRKCNDTGTVYENHGPGGREMMDCECVEETHDEASEDAADYQAAMSSGMR